MFYGFTQKIEKKMMFFLLKCKDVPRRKNYIHVIEQVMLGHMANYC